MINSRDINELHPRTRVKALHFKNQCEAFVDMVVLEVPSEPAPEPELLA